MSEGWPQPSVDVTDLTDPLWLGPEIPKTPADRRPVRDLRSPEQFRAAKRRRRMARSLALYLREPPRKRLPAARALELRSRRAAGLERLEERS